MHGIAIRVSELGKLHKLHILQKLIAITLLLSNKNKHYYTMFIREPIRFQIVIM